ncbi:MAG: hypothetical protein K6G69_06510 [Lachnospiraceae bacterium]|nr:hypothetical protein [Lachnospiraceae bacterium]
MKKAKITGIIIFMMILLIPSALWGIMGLFGVGRDYDIGEKREKSRISEDVTPMSFGEEYENYYNDRLPFRADIITLYRKIDGAVEKPYEDYLARKYSPKKEQKAEETVARTDIEQTNGESFWDAYTGSEETETSAADKNNETFKAEDAPKDEVTGEEDQTAGEEAGNDAEDAQNEETSEEDEEETEEEAEDVMQMSDMPFRCVNDKVVIGADGWLFYGEPRNIRNFKGNNLKNEDELANYARPFISMKTLCDMNGKEVRFFVCPEKEIIYSEYYPTVEVASEYRLTEQVRDYLAANSSVNIIYPKTELRNERNNYQLYYKHDSHWNAAGGYLATQCLLGTLGIERTPLYVYYYKPVKIESGDLILLGNLNPDSYPDDLNYDIGYKSNIEVIPSEPYMSDVPYMEVSSTAQNERRLVLIGDSYKMHILPYLGAEFAHVTFVHRNSLESGRAVEAICNADIIVVETSEGYIEDFSRQVWNVYSILEANTCMTD